MGVDKPFLIVYRRGKFTGGAKMHITDPLRFFFLLILISVFLSPLCMGVIECEEYPEGYLGEVCE